MPKNWNAQTFAGALLAVTITAAGCASDGAASDPTDTTSLNGNESEVPVSSEQVANPVDDGAELPDGFIQLLSRDAIEPIYNPEHVAADRIGWDDETLIIGASVNDEARAYPINYLNRHEIVNDTIDGLPVLVTW